VAAVAIRIGLILLVCAGACSDDSSDAHAGNGYAGTVELDGTFATEPEPVGPAAELHTLTIGGSFTTTGFEATVDASVTHDGAADCDYSVSWVGTKSGEPNVIPGS
jgi:hypothetical protein